MAELQEAEIRGRIKHARKEAGLTQEGLAELLEVIPRTVQNYENDHVPWGRIRDIAEITGVSTRWLLHGETASLASSQRERGDIPQLDRIESQIALIIGVLERQVGADVLAAVRKDMQQAQPPVPSTRPH